MRSADSDKVCDGTKVGIKKAAVSTEGKVIRHAGDPVADEPGADGFVGGFGDLSFYSARHEVQTIAAMDVALFQHLEEASQDKVSLVIKLLQLRTAKNKVVGDLFVQFGLGFDLRINVEAVLMSPGHGTEKGTFRHQYCSPYIVANVTVQPGLDTALADGFAKKSDVICLGGRLGAGFGPLFESRHGNKTRMDAVGDVIETVGGVVRPVHDLALNAFKAVACFPWREFSRESLMAEGEI